MGRPSASTSPHAMPHAQARKLPSSPPGLAFSSALLTLKGLGREGRPVLHYEYLYALVAAQPVTGWTPGRRHFPPMRPRLPEGTLYSENRGTALYPTAKGYLMVFA